MRINADEENNTHKLMRIKLGGSANTHKIIHIKKITQVESMLTHQMQN